MSLKERNVTKKKNQKENQKIKLKVKFSIFTIYINIELLDLTYSDILFFPGVGAVRKLR